MTIKEIELDHFNNINELKQTVETWIKEDDMYWNRWFSLYDLKTLLDYITNLQQENEKLKYNARGQVNDYFKDKYADEVLKKLEFIKDYELTCYKNYELKQENERLKNIINELEKYHIKSMKNLENTEDFKYVGINHIKILYEEHKRTLDKLKELKESVK